MTASLKDKRILVGVCGSIAAFKACELVRALRKEGVDVTVAMTRAATEFVGPATFAAFTTHPVLLEQFPADPSAGVPHVDVAEMFDLVVIAPATADMLGKAAHAIADDLISTLLNIVECPVLFVPAMNFRMWRNPATQDAVTRLRGWGRKILDPDSGTLATLHEGVGRFPETAAITGEIRGMLELSQLYRGKRVLVTAGPTREPLDPVRYLSNRSSGKMGYALAAAARDFGAEVTLISGPVGLEPVPGCDVINIETAAELLAALERKIKGQDLLLMAAAVADFRVTAPASKKISRAKGPTVVELEPVPDLLKTVRKKFKGTVVAFSLQADSDLKIAREKQKAKGAEFIAVNAYDEPGAGFDADTNHVWLLSASGEEVEFPQDTKSSIARRILSFVAPHLD